MPEASTEVVELSAGVVSQPVLSFGPYTSKVTVPVGGVAPGGTGASVAVSVNASPSVIGSCETWVVSGGVAWATEIVSAESKQFEVVGA